MSGAESVTAAPVSRPVRIGLTGPIGCGKSTVAGWLAEFGARAIDADQIAREVTPPGSPELASIVAAFGDSVLLPDGALNRAALGRIVFGDPAALARLEAIIHPAVRPRILAAIADAERAGAPAVVIEAIKLVVGGLADLCDEVWLVTCGPEEQRARLAGRGADRVDAEARIAAQRDVIDHITPNATRVIGTDGAAPDTRRLVRRAYAAALARAARG